MRTADIGKYVKVEEYEKLYAELVAARQEHATLVAGLRELVAKWQYHAGNLSPHYQAGDIYRLKECSKQLLALLPPITNGE